MDKDLFDFLKKIYKENRWLIEMDDHWGVAQNELIIDIFKFVWKGKSKKAKNIGYCKQCDKPTSLCNCKK